MSETINAINQSYHTGVADGQAAETERCVRVTLDIGDWTTTEYAAAELRRTAIEKSEVAETIPITLKRRSDSERKAYFDGVAAATDRCAALAKQIGSDFRNQVWNGAANICDHIAAEIRRTAAKRE